MQYIESEIGISLTHFFFGCCKPIVLANDRECRVRYWAYTRLQYNPCTTNISLFSILVSYMTNETRAKMKTRKSIHFASSYQSVSFRLYHTNSFSLFLRGNNIDGSGIALKPYRYSIIDHDVLDLSFYISLSNIYRVHFFGFSCRCARQPKCFQFWNGPQSLRRRFINQYIVSFYAANRTDHFWFETDLFSKSLSYPYRTESWNGMELKLHHYSNVSGSNFSIQILNCNWSSIITVKFQHYRSVMVSKLLAFGLHTSSFE